MKFVNTIAIASAFTLTAVAASAAPVTGDVVDVYKTVEIQTPYSVEVCQETAGSDPIVGGLLGAIIGGAITNNIGSGDATPGAIFGGIVGASEAAKDKGGIKCHTETRYESRYEERYDYSVINFAVNGKQHSLRFQK